MREKLGYKVDCSDVLTIAPATPLVTRTFGLELINFSTFAIYVGRGSKEAKIEIEA